MRKTANKIKKYFQNNPQKLITDEAYQLASLRHAPDMAEILWEIKRAFEKGVAPQRSLQGSSNTFFLKDSDETPIAVFKLTQSLHELAAYRLDKGHFAQVPQTVITTLEHPVLQGKKTGSCQYFIREAVTGVEMDRRVFKNFSSADIRKIAALDVRMMNADRHSSNILVLNQQDIIPIDHGHIFPYDLSCIHLDWVEWEQSSTPFTESELGYIALLDPEHDRLMLMEDIQLEEIFANRAFLATIFLQRGALRGLSARSIGNLMIRKWDQKLSTFEWLIEKIKVKNPSNWQIFSRCVYDEVEKLFDGYEEIDQYANSTIHC